MSRATSVKRLDRLEETQSPPPMQWNFEKLSKSEGIEAMGLLCLAMGVKQIPGSASGQTARLVELNNKCSGNVDVSNLSDEQLRVLASIRIPADAA